MAMYNSTTSVTTYAMHMDELTDATAKKDKESFSDPEPYYICPICQARFFNGLAASIHKHLHLQTQRERVD